MLTFTKKKALSFGWEAMKRNLPLFLQLTLVSFVLGVLQSAVRGSPHGQSSGGNFLASTILQLASIAVTMIWMKAALLVHDGQKVGLGAVVLPSWEQYFAYLLAAVLYGLMVMGGLILLVVPGLLWAVRYGFFGFLIVDKHLEPLPALKRSAELTEGVRGWLFLFGLMLLGINIVGAMALGVGLVFTIPTSVMAATYVYRRLLQEDEAAHKVEPHPVGDAHPAAV